MKRMKKIAVVALALMLMATQLVLASAEGLGNRTQDVKAKYSGGAAEPEVYSVDVTWGKMEFTYSVGGTRTWNPDTHLYDDKSTAGWTEDGNDITVVNHSNKSVNVAFSYEAAQGYSGIIGTFTAASDTLFAGSLGDPDGADKVTTNLTLSGALASSVTEFTKVGTITVALT